MDTHVTNPEPGAAPTRPEGAPPRSEREQTDDSLRDERETADRALDEELTAVDETADAVISRARARADEVLAAARAKTDREPAAPASGTASAGIIRQERAREDQALREERVSADETLREERAEHAGLLTIGREETDRDLLRERVRSDHALRTRDEFLGIVSHDLKNMLSGMVGFAELIEKGVARENHVQQVLTNAQRIQRSGARMNRLIGDLVDVASIEAGMFAVTRTIGDPRHLVTEAVDTFYAQASARGVSLVAEVPPSAALAAFDPARILQVLANLLSNAIKFTPPQGHVAVRVERIEDEIRFGVHDTGEGIPADKLEAIFERFLQVTEHDRRGVGLGLYISKCIVHGHGGRIWAERRIGEGSTFYFTLPIVHDGPTELPPRAPTSDILTNGPSRADSQ